VYIVVRLALNLDTYLENLSKNNLKQPLHNFNQISNGYSPEQTQDLKFSGIRQNNLYIFFAFSAQFLILEIDNSVDIISNFIVDLEYQSLKFSVFFNNFFDIHKLISEKSYVIV